MEMRWSHDKLITDKEFNNIDSLINWLIIIAIIPIT